jgi:hypothetical protein
MPQQTDVFILTVAALFCPCKIHATLLRLLSIPNLEQSIEISATWEIGAFFVSIRAKEG